MSTVDFSIIGAQKAATTFLQNCLANCFDLFVEPYEQPFFEEVGRDRDEFPFIPSGKDMSYGIKRPDYLCMDEVPDRLHRHNPEMKIIVVLRDPVKRAQSAYYHYVRDGLLPNLPIDEGMTAVISGSLVPNYPRAESVLEFGLYGKALSRWFEVFPVSQIKILGQNQLLEDRKKHICEILNFLGSKDTDPTEYKGRPQFAIYNNQRLAWWRLMNRFNKIYSSDMMRYHAKRKGIVACIALAFMHGVDRLLIKRIHSERQEMSSGTTRKLEHFYANDRAALIELLKRHKLNEGIVDW